MKRIKWSWGGEESGTVRDRIAMSCEKWARSLSERFECWCLSVPPYRLKIYGVLVGVMMTVLTMASLMLGFSQKSQADIGRLSIPVPLRGESAVQESVSRRAVRSRMELETLIDSLKRDSVGRLILDSMIKEGMVRLDSSLIK